MRATVDSQPCKTHFSANRLTRGWAAQAAAVQGWRVPLLRAVGAAVHNLPVLYPVHPRTAKTLAALPGGVTEETTVMGVPCVTLRDTTERP
jgi:hypothetical protein